MARVWIARHLPHASGHGHPMGSQKKNTKKRKKNCGKPWYGVGGVDCCSSLLSQVTAQVQRVE